MPVRVKMMVSLPIIIFRELTIIFTRTGNFSAYRAVAPQPMTPLARVFVTLYMCVYIYNVYTFNIYILRIRI